MLAPNFVLNIDRSRSTRLIAFALVALMLAPLAPLASAATPETVPLGMDYGSAGLLRDAGAAPTYSSYWVGMWTDTSGWTSVENVLRGSRDAGTTPVLYWYYWGDSISPSCVDNGCDGRSRAQWDRMTEDMARRVQDIMGGRRTIIVLENEFNKGGITESWYAPKFDAHLEAKALRLKQVAGVEVVLGFGAWGENAWHRFPKAIAASDMVGFQIMRASTQDSESNVRDPPNRIADIIRFVQGLAPDKKTFLYDVAISSYPNAYWANVQKEVIESILARGPEYRANGLQGLIYRELRDNPSMGTKNYFGEAEQYWGFWDRYGNTKPVWDVWKAYAAGTATPPPPPPPPAPGPSVPAMFEAESMSATTGGRQSESAASGGATWNLWTNGEVRKDVSADGGTYRFTIQARGTPAAGVDARMELRINNAAVAAFTVPAGLRTYTMDAQLPAGNSRIAVAFTNDALVNGEDRNLYVDYVRVEVPAPAVNRAPVAAFSVNGKDLGYAFDAAGSSDPDGDALTYAWNFGNGATATGRTTAYTYGSAGTYTVTLTVNDGKLSATTTRQVTATQPNRAPTAAFTVQGKDLGYAFDASGSSDADGDALTYAWNFGNGATATGRTATHTYANAGTYTVTLTVNDGKLSATTTRQISAAQPNRAPTASFTSAGEYLGHKLDASASSDPDGDALTYAWDLGDGRKASGRTVDVAYAKAGSYTVRLTVDDGRGLNATTTRIIAATEAPKPSTNITQRQAEDFAQKDNGRAFSDGSAKAGNAWLLWSNGGMRDTVNIGATSRLVVAAKGDYAAGWPEMEVRVDGALVGRILVDSSTWRDYTMPVNIAAGTHTIEVRFTNDYYGSAGDRNLNVDEVRFDNAITPRPALLIEAEDFDVKENGRAFWDGEASAGRAWLLWSTGAMSKAVQPGAGTYKVDVIAAGDEGAGWPAMQLRLDGKLIAKWDVATASWQTYSTTVTFGTERQTLSVHFTNDYHAGKVDRNLRVDALRLTPVG